MKKTVTIILLFVVTFGYSQGNPAPLKKGAIIGGGTGTVNDPLAIKEGHIYWNETLETYRYYDGSAWHNINEQISKSQTIESTDLSGIGTKKEQVAEYINSLSLDKTHDTSDLWFSVNNAFILDKDTNANSTPYQSAGLSMSTSGSLMYTSTHNNYGVQYLLSTPYDVSTATQIAVSDVLPFNDGGGLHVTDDGRHLIHANADFSNGKTVIYNMSTPHDIRTVTLISTADIGFNIGDYELYLSNDGTQFYAMDAASIKHFTFSTPYDITTRTLVGELLMDNSKYSFAFSYDLSKLFVLSVIGELEQYNLSTNGDLSTALKTNKKVDFTSIIGSANFIKIAISTDGSKMVVSRYSSGGIDAFKTLYLTSANTIGEVIKSQSNYTPNSEYYRLKNFGAGTISGVTENDLDDVGGAMKFTDLIDDRTADASAARTTLSMIPGIAATNVQDGIEELKGEIDTAVINAGGETENSVKTKYEANADTNAFTDAEKTKLANQNGVNSGDQDISGISTNASNISTFQSQQTTQDNAISNNTAKRTYPENDQNKLSLIESAATADQTSSEIVSAIDTELGQSDWKTGGSTSSITHETQNTDYQITLQDLQEGKIMVNDGGGVVTYTLPTNVPKDSSIGFLARTPTDTSKVAYPSKNVIKYAKTNQKINGETIFGIGYAGVDDGYAIGGYEDYTPAVTNLYATIPNAAGDDSDATTGFNNITAIATTSIVSTDAVLGDNHAISLVLNQDNDNISTATYAGLTIGNTYETRIRCRQPQGSSSAFFNWSGVSNDTYPSGAIGTAWEERVITFTATSETLGIKTYVGNGTDLTGDTIEISKITITDTTP